MRLMVDDIVIKVPEWVVDLESFRRWGEDDDIPERGRVSYIGNEDWVDLSSEQLYSHNEVKTETNTVLRTTTKAKRLGRYFADGAHFSNVEANLSNQPDGVFVSNESLRADRVRSIEGRAEGHVELEGSPDMVLEVVSRSSVAEDNEVLREAYFRAGVREYWLVDARKPPHEFEILRRGRSGFVAVRKREGWIHSDVFDASFRLTAQTDEDGHLAFTPEAQATRLDRT